MLHITRLKKIEKKNIIIIIIIMTMMMIDITVIIIILYWNDHYIHFEKVITNILLSYKHARFRVQIYHSQRPSYNNICSTIR